MTIEERIQEIERAVRRFTFIRSIVRVDETRYSVKYRLGIDPDLFVQLYFNVQTGTAGLVLIHQGRRIYGRDSENSHWHRHPYHDPDSHNESPQGARAVSIEEFLTEVQAILVQEDLV